MWTLLSRAQSCLSRAWEFGLAQGNEFRVSNDFLIIWFKHFLTCSIIVTSLISPSHIQWILTMLGNSLFLLSGAWQSLPRMRCGGLRDMSLWAWPNGNFELGYRYGTIHFSREMTNMYYSIKKAFISCYFAMLYLLLVDSVHHSLGCTESTNIT